MRTLPGPYVTFISFSFFSALSCVNVRFLYARKQLCMLSGYPSTRVPYPSTRVSALPGYVCLKKRVTGTANIYEKGTRRGIAPVWSLEQKKPSPLVASPSSCVCNGLRTCRCYIRFWNHIIRMMCNTHCCAPNAVVFRAHQHGCTIA